MICELRDHAARQVLRGLNLAGLEIIRTTRSAHGSDCIRYMKGVGTMKIYQFLVSHPDKGSFEINVQEDSSPEAWEAALFLFPSEEEYEVELVLCPSCLQENQ
jgi:hypothetical protein